jgi:hypothetical protein
MILDPILDLFRGRAVTIPPLDGAMKPNTLLEEAEVLRAVAQPDNLVNFNGRLLFTSGKDILAVDDGAAIAHCDSEIAALAASQDGMLAAGLDNGMIALLGRTDGRLEGFNCPVAMAFDGDGGLYVCNGSDSVKPSDWVSDLMHKNASGSVWKVDPATGYRTCLAKGLAFPFGIAIDATDGQLLVCESWQHRVVAIPLAGGTPKPLLTKLPGYPARLVPAPGGYLLSLFAPRNRLIEFVLNEDDYRTDMMREIESRFWIAPSLSPARSFLEPLQNGGVRTMGIHKPWSPSRSFGLVIGLDAKLQPMLSFQSRANGRYHGVTSVIAHDGAIIAAAKGGDAILRILTATENPA